ncbi:AarF/UbiB family protein [Paracrocinitomix mangrovi]|uniref:ABC1 kinase family protein n=1 Tax=Paracrocinitomix mangrovi TaxID=2862509 RepID=UPI001C8ECA43|nr:AarF/UbiB family protein [Paracrocinitomix mangrovi]UKN00597.1 AarF/UbiB family protein [Paracrocinitomix mangrovi]
MSTSFSYRKRTRKAIGLINRMIWRYVRLHIGKKLFGKKYYQKRLNKVELKNATDLKNGILELQGLFIKFGQLMSIMSNVLPKAYGELLESLQDKAPESPLENCKQVLEADLGKPIDQIFKEIPEKPIASASIGQVYKATLLSGEVVAVKVQHQNIKALAEADLTIIKKMLNRVSFFIKVNGMDFVYEQIRKMIMEELDFGKERVSMQIVAENLKDNPRVKVPNVHEDLCSNRVLVTSFEEGVKITNIEQLNNWNLDGEDISRELILAYCKMVLEDGFYHADPHPGNVLVNQQGEIILLDFGAMAVLSEKMRKEIPLLLQAALSQDYDKVLTSLQRMGFIGETSDARKVAKKIVEAFNKFLTNEMEISGFKMTDLKVEDIKGSSIEALLKELSISELTKTIQVPKDWVLLNRTLILVGGISSQIAPELDPVEVIKPYLKSKMMSYDSIKSMLMDAIKKQFKTLLALPSQLNTFLAKANNGELELEIKNDTQKLYAVGQQFMLVLGILASLMFYYLAKEDNWLIGTVLLSLVLLRSVWKNRKKG